MMSQALVDEFEQQVLDPYHEMAYESFNGELNFIRQTAIELAGTQVNVGNESIQVDSEVTHGTPTARFSSRHAAGSIERVCEIADLLFVLQMARLIRGISSSAKVVIDRSANSSSSSSRS